MFSKFIKCTIITTLTMGLFTFQVNTVEAASKVMWGKTELKLGQIGKVTILDRTQLVKPTSDGNYESVRILYSGDEFRVYQYKGQDGGLYGVGDGSFVEKNDAKVLYETPSKSKLELVKKGGVKGPVAKDIDEVEKIFKEVVGSKYNVSESKGLVKAMSGNDRVFSHVIDDKNYFTIDDVNEITDGYKIMKQLGLPLTEAELKTLIKKSDNEDKAITKGTLYVYANSYEMQIRW